MKKNKELREKIAEMAHLVWIDWTEYMLNNINEENMDRWERQCKTPYSELSEKEKESDRKIADRYLGFLTEALKAQEKEVLERVEKEVRKSFSDIWDSSLLGSEAFIFLQDVLSSLKK